MSKIGKKVVRTYVRRLPPDLRCSRAGVILSTEAHGTRVFGCGLDRIHLEITDFGGSVRYGEHPVDAALRELYEETLGILGPISYSDVLDCPVLYDDFSLILLLPIDVNPRKASLVFNEQLLVEQNKNSEISQLLWIAIDELRSFLSSNQEKIGNYRFYHVTEGILREGGDFYLML